MGFKLFGIEGEHSGRSIAIPPEGLLAGRDPSGCLLLINSGDVSRSHALFSVGAANRLVVTDQQSSNGTYVEREGFWVRVAGSEELQVGDKIRLGTATNVFQVQWEPDPAPIPVEIPPVPSSSPGNAPSKNAMIAVAVLLILLAVAAGGGLVFRYKIAPPSDQATETQVSPEPTQVSFPNPVTDQVDRQDDVCVGYASSDGKYVMIRSGHTITSPAIGSLSDGEKVKIIEKWKTNPNQGKKEGIICEDVVAEDIYGNMYNVSEGSIVIIEHTDYSSAVIRFIVDENKEETGQIDNYDSIQLMDQPWYKIESQDGITGWVYSGFIYEEK